MSKTYNYNITINRLNLITDFIRKNTFLKKIQIFFLLFSVSIYGYCADLTIYTYNSFSSHLGPGPIIKKIFEAQNHCKINFVSRGDSISLLNRLRIEGNNTKADIIIGIDHNLLNFAENTKLFTKSKLDTKNIKIPINWKNYTFFPYNYSYLTFIYNKKNIKIPPTSLKELIESNQNWKIIYGDPRTSNLGLGLLLWVEKIYGKNVKFAWKEFRNKTVTIPKGWSESYALFLKEESDFFLTYTSSLAYFFSKNINSDYEIVKFPEGHYLQVEFAAKLKNTKNSSLAEKFLQFILSSDCQIIMAINNWMYPICNIKLPNYFSKIFIPKIVIKYSPKEIETKRRSWIDIWQNNIN